LNRNKQESNKGKKNQKNVTTTGDPQRKTREKKTGRGEQEGLSDTTDR